MNPIEVNVIGCESLPKAGKQTYESTQYHISVKYRHEEWTVKKRYSRFIGLFD